MTTDKVLTGAAGAYYVGFQLSASGYTVGLTTCGTKALDMFVASPDTGKSITIQTKTMFNAFVPSKKWGPHWKWRVGTSPRPAYKTFFYAFVDYADWCDIEEEDAQKYRNRWDIIDNALAQNTECHA